LSLVATIGVTHAMTGAGMTAQTLAAQPPGISA
jgi:hypothetical protein